MADAQGIGRLREVGGLVLVGVLSLLPDLGAALPGRSYFFRDFSLAFYPLRLFAARELREGRVPFWNPYIYEGSFVLPAFYPVDLLHVLWPGPGAVSWLLTLHLPLAAAGMYVLCRSLGGARLGAVVAGAVYSMGGLCLSSLNLYVFLQALALAPYVVLAFGRAVRDGGRFVGVAAMVLAAALCTLALEFVAQAALLGGTLAWVASGQRRGYARLAGALAIGAGLAAVPIALTAGLLGESVRGTGFTADVALGNAIHPFSLLQTLVPDLFGSLSDPVGAWWGGGFFSKGFPYFVSLYLGPLAIALAYVGRSEVASGTRAALVLLAGVALWYSLGSWGGLASVLGSLPGFSSFRFPSKAFLLPHFVVALLSGLGLSRLRRGEGWSDLLRSAGVVGLLLAVVLIFLGAADQASLARWLGVETGVLPKVRTAVAWSATLALLSSVAGIASALLGRGNPRLSSALTTFVAAIVVFDLSRAGSGMNPQVPASFYEPIPEMAALQLASPIGQRVFSYGLDHARSFGQLRKLGPAFSKAAFYLNRQVLGPYNNVLDRVESTEATDLTSFVPRARELDGGHYAPDAVAHLVPWLRNAAVYRVLSVDPLDDAALPLLARVPVVGGATIHVYGVGDTSPPAYVACRVHPVSSVEEALRGPYAAAFKRDHDAVLERPGQVTCEKGTATRIEMRPGHERVLVEADGAAYLVVRGSYARGWVAWVDGKKAEVLRANGKHRAVFLPEGARQVQFRYEAPGILPGLAGMLGGVLALGYVMARGSTKGRPGG